MKRFSVLLKDSLNLYRANFKFLVLIILLSHFPGLILGGLVERWFRPYFLSIFHSSLANALCGAVHVISWFFTILGSIATIVAIRNLQRGEGSSIASVYSQAIKLFLPVLVVFIIEWLIITGGFVLLVAPGILFSIWYLFSLYAAVVHKKRKAEALALSKAVVRRAMGRVIGYMLLAGVIGYGPSMLFYLLMAEKGVFPSFLLVIIHGGINTILTVWITAFFFMFYIDLIKANPQISECFELERIEYEETK